MSDADTLRRFHFEDGRVRGLIVRIERSLAEVLGQHHYPDAVARLLGEALAATVLMGATLKFSGTLGLQAKSSGPVALLFAESSETFRIRGYARVQPGAAGVELDTLLQGGTLAITITPAQGERYQGIVPLDAAALAPCLEHYFAQSEQLPTVLRLACDGQRAAGLLLQALPLAPGADAAGAKARWEHLGALAATTRAAELLDDPFETLLFHLFHEEAVRLHEPAPVAFGCSCSRERASATLRSIGEQETRAVFREQGLVRIHCELCQQEYLFDGPAVDRLFETRAEDGGTFH
jgi:molecular chaperone Hsp33